MKGKEERKTGENRKWKEKEGGKLEKRGKMKGRKWKEGKGSEGKKERKFMNELRNKEGRNWKRERNVKKK